MFKTIDAYYGKDGIKLVGYKSQMIAYTLAVLSRVTNKFLDLDSIWNEQCVISPSLYTELGGDMSAIYAKMLMGTSNITYRVKIAYTADNGRKMNKWEVRTVPQSELNKIKGTVLYGVMLLVKQLQPLVWNHILDVDAGIDIGTNSKKAACWTNLISKNIERGIRIPDGIISNTVEEEITPSMSRTIDKANSYDYETWRNLNLWGKSTGILSPKESAFMGSIYWQCKKGKELTFKQSRYALNVLEKAREAGWEE